MSTRYAILIEDGEGNTIVSDIKQMEGAAPDVGGHAKAVKVPDGVIIGMVKGGPVQSVAGFGFPEGSVPVRSETGISRVDAPASKGKAAK